MFPWPTRRHHRASTGKRSKKPFASPEAAQRWLEFRRIGYQFPLMALAGFMALALVMATYMLSRGSGMTSVVRWQPSVALQGARAFYESRNSVLLVGATSFLAAAWAAGLLVFALHRRESISSFVLARPLGTLRLAKARLSAGLRSMAMGVALFVLMSALGMLVNWYGESSFIDNWTLELPSVSRFLGVLGTLLGLATVSWVAWWMRPKALVVLCGLGAIILLVMWTVILLLGHFDENIWGPWLRIAICVAAAIWGAARFRHAFREGLISRAILIAVGCAWPFLAWGCYHFLVLTEMGDLRPAWFWALVAATGALLPFALVPQAIDRQRHQ